jgi:hypothetical protein
MIHNKIPELLLILAGVIIFFITTYLWSKIEYRVKLNQCRKYEARTGLKGCDLCGGRCIGHYWT